MNAERGRFYVNQRRTRVLFEQRTPSIQNRWRFRAARTPLHTYSLYVVKRLLQPSVQRIFAFCHITEKNHKNDNQK